MTNQSIFVIKFLISKQFIYKGKSVILIKNQSNIMINVLNNVFMIIAMSKNDNISMYQKNIIFNIKRSTFKNYELNMRKSPLNIILKVSLWFLL